MFASLPPGGNFIRSDSKPSSPTGASEPFRRHNGQPGGHPSITRGYPGRFSYRELVSGFPHEHVRGHPDGHPEEQGAHPVSQQHDIPEEPGDDLLDDEAGYYDADDHFEDQRDVGDVGTPDSRNARLWTTTETSMPSLNVDPPSYNLDQSRQYHSTGYLNDEYDEVFGPEVNPDPLRGSTLPYRTDTPPDPQAAHEDPSHGRKSASHRPLGDNARRHHSKPDIDVSGVVPGTSLLRLNVRGTRMWLPSHTLQRAPSSRLARLSPNAPNYDRNEREYLYDRNPVLVQHILDFYSNGELHFPVELCQEIVERELDFWELDESALAFCCWSRQKQHESKEDTLMRVHTSIRDLRTRIVEGKVPQYPHSRSTGEYALNETDNSMDLTNREKLWLFLEDPASSSYARVWHGLLAFSCVVSTISLMLGSLLEFRVLDENKSMSNSSDYNLTLISEKYKDDPIHVFVISKPHTVLVLVDLAVVILLTADLATRFLLSRFKTQFWRDPLNISDLLGVIPVWVTLIFEAIGTEFWLEQTDFTKKSAFYCVGALGCFRLFRLIRVLRSISGFVILKMALFASFKELLMLFTFLMITSVINAALIFYMEVESRNIESIPAGLWWSVITMTTVGYGDVHPVTVPGKFLAVFCITTGILVVALPVPIIANNFSFMHHLVQLSRLKGKRERERSINNGPIKVRQISEH